MFTKISLLVLAIGLMHSQCSAQTVADEIMMTFFFGATGSIQYSVHNFHEVFNHPSFVRNRQTAVFHYGFSQTPNSANVAELVDSYRSTQDVNFVFISYDGVTTNTIFNARELGEGLADAYIRLFDQGYSSMNMHLIGFSLGAQIQAVASRTVQQRTSRRHIVGRLTGLDPGQVPTIWVAIVGRLGSADAQFVDSIHTESVGFGELESAGHVQFMVNGGVEQPHCASIITVNAQTCSHNFAVFAWNEAVRARAARFPALPCPTWEQFLAGGCNNNTPVGNMGPITQLNLRGRYFLRTNGQAPWSRNVATP